MIRSTAQSTRIRLRSSHRRVLLKSSHRRAGTEEVARDDARERYLAPPKKLRR